VCLNVYQHFGDCTTAEANVSQGKIGKVEVYQGVEMGVRGDSKNDEHIPKHCDQLHG
jgi:hypothetical protein